MATFQHRAEVLPRECGDDSILGFFGDYAASSAVGLDKPSVIRGEQPARVPAEFARWLEHKHAAGDRRAERLPSKPNPGARSGGPAQRKVRLELFVYQPGHPAARISQRQMRSGGAAIVISLCAKTGDRSGSKPGGHFIEKVAHCAWPTPPSSLNAVGGPELDSAGGCPTIRAAATFVSKLVATPWSPSSIVARMQLVS